VLAQHYSTGPSYRSLTKVFSQTAVAYSLMGEIAFHIIVCLLFTTVFTHLIQRSAPTVSIISIVRFREGLFEVLLRTFVFFYTIVIGTFRTWWNWFPVTTKSTFEFPYMSNRQKGESRLLKVNDDERCTGQLHVGKHSPARPCTISCWPLSCVIHIHTHTHTVRFS
jgi:hypothetical protein